MRLLLPLFVLLALQACNSKKFLTNDYDEYANQHAVVAVLPYDITIIGKDAKSLSEEKLDAMIVSESSIFQENLYVEILRRTGRDKKDIRVSVQDIRKTNRLLREAHISALNIKEYSASELGQILKVDAVVTTRLIKEGFLDRTTAMFLDVVADELLDRIDNKPILHNRSKLTRASKVDVYASIVDVTIDRPIWVYATECDLSWRKDPSEVVESINKRISKKFPYRDR